MANQVTEPCKAGPDNQKERRIAVQTLLGSFRLATNCTPKKAEGCGLARASEHCGSWLGHAFPNSMFRLATDSRSPGATWTLTIHIASSPDITTPSRCFWQGSISIRCTCLSLFPCSALLRACTGRRLWAGPSGAEALDESASVGICLLYEESPIQGANWCLSKPRVQLQRHGLHLGSTTSPSFAIGCSLLQPGRR